MPEPVYISFKLENGDYLPGIATLDDNKNLWPGLAFEHKVGNSYRQDTWKGDFIVSFKPITIWLELSSFMPQLYRAMVRGTELERVEIYWIGAVRHQSKPGLYFKHTLYPVKTTGFQIEMPNVKDKRFERFGHLVKLQMWYRFMEILYVPGHHQKKIEWLSYLGVSREMEKFMAGWEVVEAPERPPVSLEAPGWEHIDESLKDEKEAVIGERIRLLVDVTNIRDGESVKFEICYYNDQNANCNFQTVSGKVANGTATAEWTIDYSTIKDGAKAKDKSDLYKLRFEPMYSGKYGARTDIPVRPAKIFCDFMEIADVHFNTGSPLPCLDDKGSLIAALAASLKFANDNPGKEVVLFGHTDTTGDAADNFDLSGWRAEAVKTVLTNDKQRWTDLADGQATVTDAQMFLTSLTKRYGWQCDPGPADGKDGPKTTAGREAFQRQFNEKCGGSLTIDGIFGEQSWGAMFKVVRALLTDEYKTATESETLPALTFASEGKGIYACGESLPIDEKDRDNYRSADNRRVEICFFDKGKCPKLPKHPKKAAPVTKVECPVYDPKRVDRRMIKPTLSSADSTDELIFYRPETNEYWELTDKTDIDLFMEEAAYMNEFAQKVQDTRNLPSITEQATAAAKNQTTFMGIMGDKQLVKGKRLVDELLAIKTNRRWPIGLKSIVYIRKNVQRRNGQDVAIKGYWRKHSKEYVEKRLKEFLKQDEKSANTPEATIKAVFWKKDFNDYSAFKFVPTDPETGEPQKDLLKDNDHWSLGAEAQLLRYAAGASLFMDVAKIRKKQLKIGVEANVTVSLAEGTVEGAFHLPDKDGGNILSAFTSSEKLKELVTQGFRHRIYRPAEYRFQPES
jgi:outer membrane protein OmpA-like peptidoglycan-associated protein/type VI protein secretion system component Hcp